MECKVCGSALEEGRVRCPECGFPVDVYKRQEYLTA